MIYLGAFGSAVRWRKPDPRCCLHDKRLGIYIQPTTLKRDGRWKPAYCLLNGIASAEVAEAYFAP